MSKTSRSIREDNPPLEEKNLFIPPFTMSNSAFVFTFQNFFPIKEFFSGVKLPERKADHSPSPSTYVKNGGAIPPLPHMSSWHSV
jgi:hypothetical protein